MTDHDDAMVSVPAAEPGSLLPAPADPLGDAQQRWAQQLVAQAQAEGVSLVGPGGLLAGLTKQVLELGLEVEMSEHLGYDKHDPAGRDGGNSRNGTRSKTVITEVGPVELDVPRDRGGTFSPQTVKKRQRRLEGLDAMVLSLAAGSMTTGDVQAHLKAVFGTEISRETICRRSPMRSSTR